jgi:hypothetical protein
VSASATPRRAVKPMPTRWRSCVHAPRWRD